jgi:hypothetical protein
MILFLEAIWRGVHDDIRKDRAEPRDFLRTGQ